MSLIYIGACFKALASNPLASKLRFCDYEELNLLKVSHDEFPLLLDAIKSLDFIDEVSLISTCNRFEVYCFSSKELRQAEIELIINSIRSINKNTIPLSVLCDEEALIHFYRTYCGLNSSLIGENEIAQQIDISFRQSFAMGYIQRHGMSLLSEAMRCRDFFDREIYETKVSYCDIAIKSCLAKLKIMKPNRVTVLGSGSTALQAVSALVNSGIEASHINLIHRISSSSGQIENFKNNPRFDGIKFTRAKYGYHLPKVRDMIFNSDLVVFAIDSKDPVIDFDQGYKVSIIDFNSKASCSFSPEASLEKYFSGRELDGFVRDYSERLLQKTSFQSKIQLADHFLSELIKEQNKQVA